MQKYNTLLTFFSEWCIAGISSSGVESLPLFLVCGMQIKDAIDKYLIKCRADDLCKETIRDKKRHLSLLPWTKEIENINADDLYDFLSTINVTPVVEHKIRRDLRAFFHYLNEMGLNIVPYTLIKNSSVCHKIRPRVLPNEYLAMRKMCHNYRELAVIDMLWDTGLRRGELVNIRLKDVDFKEKTFYVETEKTHKQRQCWYSHDLTEYIKLYKPKERLFEITDKTVGWIIKELKERAGIEREITAHTFRHAFASDLLEGGASLQDTALLCGHSKIQTTLIYYHSSNLRKAWKKRKNKNI